MNLKRRAVILSIIIPVIMLTAAFLSARSWMGDSRLEYKNLNRIYQSPELLIYADYDRDLIYTENFQELYRATVEKNKNLLGVEFDRQVAVVLLKWDGSNERFFKSKGTTAYTELDKDKIIMLDFATAPEKVIEENGSPFDLIYEDLFVHQLEHLILRLNMERLNAIQEEGVCLAMPLVIIDKYPPLEDADPEYISSIMKDDNLVNRNPSMALSYYIISYFPEKLREFLETKSVYFFLDENTDIKAEYGKWRMGLLSQALEKTTGVSDFQSY